MTPDTKSHSARLADRVRSLMPRKRSELLAVGCRELQRAAFHCRAVVRLRQLVDDPLPHRIENDQHAAVIVSAVGAVAIKDGAACGLFRYRATTLKTSRLGELTVNGFGCHLLRPMPDFIR